MTNNNSLNVDGVIVMWSLAETSYLARVRDGLINIGHENHIPKPRTNAACLKDALRDVCGNSKVLIRPLESEGGTEGFCVVEERRGTDGNNFEIDLVAKVTPEPRIKLRPFDHRAQPITDGFNKQLGLVKPASVTSSLTGIISSLGGTTLRPHGGVYWLPGYALKDWQAVCEVIENAAHDGKNCMYLVRHQLDQDAIRVVHHAIASEVQTELDVIQKEIMEDGLGERALQRRTEQAYRMRTKIKEYAELLNVNLAQLLTQVESVETSIAQAAIIGAGSAVA